MAPSSRGLGHLPFTEATGVRIPLGLFSKFQIKLFEDKDLGLLKFNLIKGDFRKFEGSWKIQSIKNTSKNSLIYDLTVQGCQWMPIKMIEKRLKKDLSENLIAVDKQAKSSEIV